MPLPHNIAIEDLAEAMDQWVDEIESQSWEQPLRKCMPTISQDVEDHFMASMGDDGNWKPRKDTLPHPILILTGLLIEAARDTGNSGNIHEVTKDTLTYGVDGSVVNYAGYHQNGTSRMVARPFMWLSDKAIDACVEIFTAEAFTIISK